MLHAPPLWYHLPGMKAWSCHLRNKIKKGTGNCWASWDTSQCFLGQVPLSPDKHMTTPSFAEKFRLQYNHWKKGESTGVNNILAKLVQAGGEDVVTALTTICNKIGQTGEWPTPWTQSLVITLPKKGNLQQCQNYWTISLISHPSKVMLKIILNRLKPQAEKIIAEEQAGFRADLQPTHSLWEISSAPAWPLPCLHRLQKGLWQGLACSFMGNHDEVHQHQPYPSHQIPL